MNRGRQFGELLPSNVPGPKCRRSRAIMSLRSTVLPHPTLADDDDRLAAQDVEIHAGKDALLLKLHAERLERDQRRAVGWVHGGSKKRA